MQGSYKNNGLPQPYYMKPSKKRSSPYDNMPVKFFTTPARRLIGYLIMLLLLGTSVYWISQELKPGPDPVYEIVKPDEANSNINKILNNVDSKADKESENIDLAGNLAQNSKGEIGLGIVEAPKGGIANEAPIVGSNEDIIVGNGNSKNNKQSAQKNPASKSKGYKATKGDSKPESEDEPIKPPFEILDIETAKDKIGNAMDN